MNTGPGEQGGSLGNTLTSHESGQEVADHCPMALSTNEYALLSSISTALCNKTHTICWRCFETIFFYSAE